MAVPVLSIYRAREDQVGGIDHPISLESRIIPSREGDTLPLYCLCSNVYRTWFERRPDLFPPVHPRRHVLLLGRGLNTPSIPPECVALSSPQERPHPDQPPQGRAVVWRSDFRHRGGERVILTKWCTCGDEKSRIRWACEFCRTFDKTNWIDVFWYKLLFKLIEILPLRFALFFYRIQYLGFGKIAELKHISLQTVWEAQRKYGFYYLE